MIVALFRLRECREGFAVKQCGRLDPSPKEKLGLNELVQESHHWKPGNSQ